MNVSVESAAPVVVLNLDVRELAGILALHRAHGAGTPAGLRGDIEGGLEMAFKSLPEPWHGQVNAALEASYSRRSGYVYDVIDESFGWSA